MFLFSITSGVLACYLKETRIDEEVNQKEEDKNCNRISMALIGDNNIEEYNYLILNTI